jgi:lysophospholipase L1-like esterase
MKRALIACSCLLATCFAQNGVPAPHSNLHPPQEDWARLSVYAADNQRLAQDAGAKSRVVFLGDSITFHWQDTKYSSLFQSKPNFIDRGINGNNAAQMLLRYRADVLALRPKVVVLLGGTNDLAAFKVPDIVTFIEQSISSMVEIAQLYHERIVLCSVLPVTDAIHPQTPQRSPQDILRLNAWLKSYAAQKRLPYIDYYSLVSDGHDRLRTDLTVDGLHPNGEGYKLMESVLLPVVEKELARR